MSMRIAFDVDGVLANFLKTYYEIINGVYPGRIEDGYVQKDWYLTDRLTEEEEKVAWGQLLLKRDLWFSLDALAGLTELRNGMKALLNAGIDVLFVTQRPKTLGNTSTIQTVQWLKKHGVWGDNCAVIVVDNTTDKAKVYDALNVSFAVDDRVDNVLAAQIVPNHQSYMLRQTWNSGPENAMLPSVGSVKEFLDIVLKYANANNTY